MSYFWLNTNNISDKFHADGGFGELNTNSRNHVNMHDHGFNFNSGVNPNLIANAYDVNMHDADDEVEDEEFVYSDADKEEEESGGLKRGPWSTEEDDLLKRMVRKYKTRNWRAVGSVLNRTSKSCRLRWCNQISPDINHERFTEDEDWKIMTLHARLGNKWADIARRIKTGRTDNQIKNRWHSSLSRRVRQIEPQPQPEALPSRGSQSRSGPKYDGFPGNHRNSTLKRRRLEEQNEPQWQDSPPRASTWAGRLRKKPSVSLNSRRQSSRSGPNNCDPVPAPEPVETDPHAADRYYFPVLSSAFNLSNSPPSPPAADFVLGTLPSDALRHAGNNRFQSPGIHVSPASSDPLVTGAPSSHLFSASPMDIFGSPVPLGTQFPNYASTSTSGFPAPAPAAPAFDQLTSLSMCIPSQETDDVKYPNRFVCY